MKKKSDLLKLQKWQERFQKSKNDYEAEIAKMTVRERYYQGCKDIYNPDGKKATRGAANTRNIVFELIESQVESAYPTPKVTPYRKEDEERAKAIEDMLRAEMDRLPTEKLNDTDERTTPIQGGDFFLVEWDASRHTHTTLGEIVIQLVHPRKVIPQQGVESLEKSDWVFLELAQTKEAIKRRYDIDVMDEGEEDPEIRGEKSKQSDNIVTQVIVYYRNQNGGIGRFSWVNDIVLEDLEDCQTPMQHYCSKCDLSFSASYTECPYCGYKKLQKKPQEFIELYEDVVLYDENGVERKRIPAYTQVVDESGFLRMEHTKIPVYKSNLFPLVLRKNVSIDGKFLGNSDVDFIRDQQNEINQYLTKISDKTKSGGSVVVKPSTLPMKNTDEEMKLIEVDNPAEAGQIRVYNLQADFSGDLQMAENNYNWSRQTIGITDSFQGRHDATATSGKAKEFSAAQAAGRFESKKTMKRAAYADLYQLMFQIILSCADEPRQFRSVDRQGNDGYSKFHKWDFLEQDAAGEWYWNDSFLFSTDNTGNLSQNRESLWQEARSNFESGAFGNPQDINVLMMYWTMMKELHYPLAGTVLSNLQEQKAQQEQQEQMQQQMMMQQQAMAQSIM